MLSLVSHLRTGSTFNHVHIASTVLLFMSSEGFSGLPLKQILGRQSKEDSETLVSG